MARFPRPIPYVTGLDGSPLTMPAQGQSPQTVVEGGAVAALSRDAHHQFSKSNQLSVELIAGVGVKGDVHSGPLVKNRYLAKRNPCMPNLRQIHLMPAELLEELHNIGFWVGPGDLGENITTRGIDLVGLPLGSVLYLGEKAAIEVTGLRTPCLQIDKFRKGLKRAMIVTGHRSLVCYKAGIMGVVRAGGIVNSNDSIKVVRPQRPWRSLPAL
jgi:MOSC domain-containing protein YiiM